MKKIYTKFCIITALFAITANVKAATYYLKAGGSMTVLADWGTNTNGTGTAPTAFTGAHVWNVHNNASVTLNTTFAVSGTSTVNIGDGVSAIDFNFNGSAQLGNPTFPILRVNNAAIFHFDRTLSVFYSPAKTTFNTGSSFVVESSCDAIPADNFQALTINNSYVPLVGNTACRDLTISNSSMLSLNAGTLSITGNIASTSGQIEGDPYGSMLVFGGTSNGTINFATGFEIVSHLIKTGTGTVGFSTDVLVIDVINPNSSFTIVGGTLDLSSRYLMLSTCNSNFSSGGLLKGNSSTRLDIADNSTVTGTMGFDPTGNTINAFNFYNGCTGSLTFGSMLNITDSLKIDGISLNANGNLTLKSTSTLKGRVAEISGGGSLTGNITVETFIPGPTTDWAVLGASGVSGLTFNSWYGQIPMAIEGSATGVTSTSGQYFESVQGWDETDAYGYDTTITVSTPINPGQGYWLFVGTGLSSTADITTSVSGGVVTGIQNLPLSNSAQGGDCLLANPFPSPISWDRIVASNPGVTSGAIYIYNADAGVTGSYVSGVGTNGVNSTIPMGQGFYVEASGATPLLIDESMKVSNNTGANPVLKSSSISSSIGNVVKLKLTDGLYYDETALRFHSSATSGYDSNLDAKKYFDSPGYAGYASMGPWTKRTTISTKGGSLDYSINSLPYATTSNAVIPVLVKVYASGQHTISATGINNLAPGTCVTLKDKLLNINHNLAASDYVFSISDTTSTPRFELTICANVAASVNELNAAESNEISVFPNPSNGDVNISTTIPGKYEIVNQIGQTVFVFEKSNEYAEVIPVKGLQSGIYFLKANSRNLNKKIIITE